MTTSPFDSVLSPAPEWLLAPGEPFGTAELQVMARTGLLRSVMGGLYVTNEQSDTVDTRAVVAHYLGQMYLTESWTVTLQTALWVYVGGNPPHHFDAAVTRYHRPPLKRPAVQLQLRQSEVARQAICRPQRPTDVVQTGPLRHTSPERTVEDLLRLGTSISLDGTMRRLLQRCDRDRLRERFANHRYLAGMTRAHQRLETLLESIPS